jgi:hypothetical protein
MDRLMNTTTGPSDRDRQVDEIIADYFEAEVRGQPPDRAELLARHPEFADELRAFFADHDALKLMAQQGPATLPPEAPVVPNLANAPTCPPADHSPLATHPSPPGAKIGCFGDYEILEEIARGGMGVVYSGLQGAAD